MKTQKFLLLFGLLIGITAAQLVAQRPVFKSPIVEMNRNVRLPLYCGTSSEYVDVLAIHQPYYLWSVYKPIGDDDYEWFISHWTDVVFTAEISGETFRIIAGSERFVKGEVYDIKMNLTGSEGTKIRLHLSGYGQWGFLDGWTPTLAKCF